MIPIPTSHLLLAILSPPIPRFAGRELSSALRFKPTTRTVDPGIKLRIAVDAPALDLGRTYSGNALTHHGRLVRHDRTRPHRTQVWQPFAGLLGLPSNSRSRRDHQGPL